MNTPTKKHWKKALHEIIYEADTQAGKLFDIILFITIIASVVLVMLESVKSIDMRYHRIINTAEWFITILFSLEYIARIIVVKKPLKYITSFFGIVDLLSTAPKYISLLFGGVHALAALRALRLLRIFRILKLVRYLGASHTIIRALRASRVKISVFLFTVIIISIILGTIMYLVEGDDAGFTSIPASVYWCIVTLTTVGYGDISPTTPLGQFIASIVMILGYGIIAVPTGIVSAEYATQRKANKSKSPNIPLNSQSCANCMAEKHKDGAEFCYNCGHKLH
ncbi:ion transporter [Snuella sedimenti]|uniref:Ion transporter n=1 Tax=Snuella sedimenti TaxID=2798802 RepID=A0A8J7IGU4_9FLAO|nr:ion transporter [Snuella sedimenti]MBJ6367201.1 ion transporter [Snuella sedimenti]